MSRTLFLHLALMLLLLAGCQAATLPTTNPAGDLSVGAEPERHFTGQSPLPPRAERTLAYIRQQPISADDLLPDLAEAAGGQVLLDMVIDQALKTRLAEHGWKVEPARIEAEKNILLQALHNDPDQAQRLLNELRQERGLGDLRFQQLLWRNAALRALIQDQVVVSDTAVRQAYDVQYGPKYEGRIVVVDDFKKAADVVRQARAGASFIDLAIAFSTDVSKAQGGLLPPISPEDPTFPLAVRRALAGLQVNAVSDPVVLEKGFAVLRLERKIEGGVVRFDDVKGALTQRVRRQIERMLIQRLVREIVSQADVVVTDPALQRSFAWQKKQLLTEP